MKGPGERICNRDGMGREGDGRASGYGIEMWWEGKGIGDRREGGGEGIWNRNRRGERYGIEMERNTRESGTIDPPQNAST